jgi:putative transposase
VESTSLQQAVWDLQVAFTNPLKNQKSNTPTFKKKYKTKPSFRQTIPANKKIINKNILTLRKYGDIKFKTSKKYEKILNDTETKINNITVYFDGVNYYASINVEITDIPEQFPLTGKQIGCDINSNKNGWLVTSDGQKEHFNVDYQNQVIKDINQIMAKCKKGSRKWKKQQKRLQKNGYNKRTNILKDYIEKLSYNLVKEYDTIVFEENYASIKILIGGEQNMIFPLSQFIKRLQDKFKLHKPDAEGVVFVNSKNTSRKCHHCGYVHEDLDVKTRNFVCQKCGKSLDRDVNASINILNRWFNGDSLDNTQINR